MEESRKITTNEYEIECRHLENIWSTHVDEVSRQLEHFKLEIVNDDKEQLDSYKGNMKLEDGCKNTFGRSQRNFLVGQSVGPSVRASFCRIC